jgi:hypothetical protein
MSVYHVKQKQPHKCSGARSRGERRVVIPSPKRYRLLDDPGLLPHPPSFFQAASAGRDAAVAQCARRMHDLHIASSSSSVPNHVPATSQRSKITLDPYDIIGCSNMPEDASRTPITLCAGMALNVDQRARQTASGNTSLSRRNPSICPRLQLSRRWSMDFQDPVSARCRSSSRDIFSKT